MEANDFKFCYKKIILVVLLFTGLNGALAQKLTNTNWYFGSGPNGIKFNRGTGKAELITNKAALGSGGSAVATLPTNGNLFFYTDGNTVYDACNEAMPNGFNLNANSSANQPVAICAVPKAKGQYYIFTNTANLVLGQLGRIYWTKVDSALNGNSPFPNPPLGAVESKNNTIAGLTNRSEGMVVIPNKDGTGYWLLTHKSGSAEYAATKIDASGTFETTPSTVGLPLSVANFSVSPITDKDPAKKKFRKIAVAPQSTNSNAIILTFDTDAGTLALDKTIPNSGRNTSNGQAIYDIEWDAKGQFLYLSYYGDGTTSDVLQYDYQNPTSSLTSVLPPTFKPTQSLGLQVGADSAMYYLYKSAGKFLVGKFTKTDKAASEVKFNEQPLGAIDFEGTQFPAFLPDKALNISVTFVPLTTCQNAPTAFYPTVTPNADSLVWNFGDGKGSKQWSPVHTFSKGGSTTVKVTAYWQGQSESFTQSVTVKPFALKITLVQDTTACCCELPKGKQCKLGSLPCESKTQFSVIAKVQGGTPASADWSNGDIGLTLRPDSAGYYVLTISDGVCEAAAGVNVKEYGLNDQRSNKWYFGNKAGIDFTTNRALNDSGMTAPEGCAIVCDRNGQTIFYTDGNTVYDRTNNAIDTGIGGSIDGASSQSSLIFQVPGDESLYYIFTTQAFEDGSANEARYSLFDWKKNNGKGGLVQKNVLLFSKTTERITANGNWVIFHEYGNNVFRSYRITQEGIGAPVFSSVGTDHSQCEGGAEGYMKLGPKNTLAVPLTYNGGNFIELFHLNDTTGRVVKFSKTEANNKLNLNESAGKVYGIEFTSSNKKGLKLFATVNNDANSKFIEFAIDSLSKPTLLKSTPAADLGAIQTAPNGAIYVAVKGSKSLSVIGPGGDLTSPSSLQSDGFMLADGTTSALGLPNFRQQQGNGFGSPALTFTGVCAGDSTRFTGEGTDSIDKFAWSVADSKDPTKTFPFKDPTKQNPAILLPAGDYIVSLRVYNRCSLDTTLTAKFSVFAPPAKVLLPSQSLCNGPVTLNANPSKTAGLTYSWSTGETTPTILVSKPILDISVTITNDKGCSTKSTTGVASSSVEFQLVADQTICQNVAVAPIKPFVYTTGYSYEWTIKNETTGSTTAGTGEQQAVDTSTPGIFSYSVKITDSNGCFATDDVKFTINPAPNVTLPLPDDPSGCGVADGKIQIILTNSIPPGGPYSISLDGPTPTQLFDKTVALSPIPISGLKAGGYVVTVSDQLSGCSTIKSIGLTDASWTIISTPTACDPSSVTTSVASGSPSPGELTFTFRGTGVGSPILSVTPLLTTTVLVPQGTWTAEAKDVSGCTAVDPTPLVVTPNPTITITPNASCSSLTATISQAGNFDILWTLPSGGTVSGPTVAANSPGDYLATATKQGVVPSCSFSTTYQLKVVNPTIKQSETCSDEVILTAAPSGNYYRYTWTGGPNNNTFYGQQIALGVGEGGTYTVTVKDTQTGCSKTSTIDAKVAGKVTAYLSSTPPCKDGKPFTLTATATPSTGVNYNWFFNGSPIAGVTTDSKSISQLEEGVYQVKVSSVADPTCKAEPSVTIVRNPSPEGNLPPAAIICADPDNKDPLTAKVDLDPGTFTRYQWYKNDAALSGETKQIYTATSPGLYRVDIGNSYNCVASDKTEVRNECIPKLVAPTAFRPGSKEPTNQNFFVYSFFITDQFEVSIFNRWGELVYESKDKNFKWNGTYNNQGQPLPAGTYAYSIKYISSFRPDKGIQEQRGGVVLIR